MEAKITNQQPAPEFKMSTKEERSSPLKSFALTALVKDIVPTIAKTKEAAWNVKDIITRHYPWMQKLAIIRYKNRVQ